MNALTHAISVALLHFVWQGLLVALFLWVALAALRKSSAQIRYVVSCAALALMTVLPLLTASIVYRAAISANSVAGQTAVIPFSLSPAALPAPSLPAWIAWLETWALPIWFAGVLIFAIRLLRILRYVVRLQREGNPAQASLVVAISTLARRMKIDRPVRVLISSLTDTPSVAGWLRPVVLLPAATLLNLSAEQLEAVLVHELAHIRRHDYLVNILQILAETLLFYHPALWWVSSRIRSERELCCDDLVVEICGDPVGYARALTKLERLRVFAPALTVSSTGGPLLHRIRRLTGQAEEQPPSKFPALLALSLALACLLTNLRWAQAQPQNATEPAVSHDTIWVDTVKHGDFPVSVRALGTITSAAVAELKVVASQSNLVQTGQPALIELRGGVRIAGKVARTNSSIVKGTFTVAVNLQTPRPDLVGQTVDGIIQIRVVKDVTYVGRPVVSQWNSAGAIFKIDSGGAQATRVKVRFGVGSVNSIQILEGLQPGDRVILSDMSKYDGYDRIRIE